MSHPVCRILAVFYLLGLATGATAAPTAGSIEYQNLGSARHLDAINILPAWARGGTGRGVTIAVIDSGLDLTHPELQGRIAGGGRSFVPGFGGLQDDALGHGTAVAGIIAANHQNLGIVGVAYQASILPYKIFHNDQGAGATEVINAINAAAANSAVKVLNLSFGGAQSFAGELAALQNAVNNRKFISIAAGNSGAGSPEFPAAYAGQLGTGVIAVGSLGPDGQIAFFSNRAGATMNQYLLAPGFGVWSTAPGGGFKPVSGTSFSAAYVSGAAALLFQLFPNLTPAQVGSILLASTDDIGPPGPDPTNGKGRLNIGRAAGPLGNTIVPAGGSASAGGAPLNDAALAVSPSIRAALLKQAGHLGPAVFLDSYDRAYRIDLANLIRPSSTRHRFSDLFGSQLNDVNAFDVKLGNDLRLSLGYTPATIHLQRRDYDQLPSAGTWGEFSAVDVTASIAGTKSGIDYRLDINQRPQRFASVHPSVTGDSTIRFLGQHALTTPYLGFAGREHALTTTIPFANDLSANIVHSLRHDGEVHGLDSNATMAEVVWQTNERLTTRLRYGQLLEYGSLYGGASGGSFSVARANTRSAGVSAAFRINKTWSLVTNADVGLTKVTPASNSLMQNFSTLASNAYSVGLLGKGIWYARDEFGFALTRPLRVQSGSASLSIPVAMDENEVIDRKNMELSLRPGAQEVDLEAYYRLPLGRQTRLATNFYFARHPDHDRSANPTFAATVSIRHNF